VDAELNLIKGGGACLTQEKVVAASARTFVVIADYTKQSEVLCTKWKAGIPVEVIPMSYMPVKHHIERRFGGIAEVPYL
jgi:ribose 5-phosphate isomerase A